MPFWLIANGGSNGVFKHIITFRGAQRFTQICATFLAKTGLDFARASDPHAIAALAEIVG